MALHVLKLTPIHAVVRVSGTGTETINLSTTLKLAEETIGTPIVDIKAIWGACVSATGNTIVRNSVTLWNLTNIPFHFQFDGWSDITEHGSNIAVTIGASGGSIVLELVKKAGYGLNQHNPLI